MSDQIAVPKIDPNAIRARKRRNIWLALALVAFVILMGVATALRIKQGAGVSACKGALYWDMRSNSCIEQAPEPDLETVVKGEDS